MTVEEQAYESTVQTEAPLFAPVRYGGFWMRFWAYLLDLLIVGSLNRLVVYPLFHILGAPMEEKTMFSPIAVATGIVFYAYFVMMTKYFQQTLGKMVFGLKVTDVNGRSLTWLTVIFREVVGKFVSKFILFIGFLFAAFSAKKQALHDQIADTVVVHE